MGSQLPKDNRWSIDNGIIIPIIQGHRNSLMGIVRLQFRRTDLSIQPYQEQLTLQIKHKSSK